MKKDKKPSLIFLKNCSSSEKNDLLKVFKSFDLNFFKKEMVVLKINSLDENSRIEVRRVINNRDAFIILMSESINVSNFAWKCNADHFINLSDKSWQYDLSEVLKKEYKKSNYLYSQKIKFKSHHKVDFIYPPEIIVVLANGNYSEISLSNGKKILVSKQIGVLEKEFQYWNQLKRFGKSVIINLNKISSIKDKTIIFNNNEQYSFPKYSRSFIYLKDCLLWNN